MHRCCTKPQDLFFNIFLEGSVLICCFVDCLSHLTIDHASLSRRSTVPRHNDYLQHLGVHYVCSTYYIQKMFILSPSYLLGRELLQQRRLQECSNRRPRGRLCPSNLQNNFHVKLTDSDAADLKLSSKRAFGGRSSVSVSARTLRTSLLEATTETTSGKR